MRPWSKVSNAIALASQRERMLSGRPASMLEGHAELLAMDAAGMLAELSLTARASTLGWSRGKLRRFLDRVDEPKTDTSADQKRTGTPEESREDTPQREPVANRKRTDNGPSRASPTREEDRDRDRDHSLSVSTDGLAPAQVLERLNLVRREMHSTLGGSPARRLTLTSKRQAALTRCIREVKAMGLDKDLLDVFELAARWMYTSSNIRAGGARRTGEPIGTLLRTACVEYIELALQEAATGHAPPVDDSEHARRRFQLMVSDWVAQEEPSHG